MSPFALDYELDVSRWTLREVAARGTLVVECRRCRKLAVVSVETLARFAETTPVGNVQKRMRCRQCGACYPDTLVRLKIRRGDLAWWPMPPRLGR